MQVTIQQAYDMACTLLGDQLVQNRLMQERAYFPEEEAPAGEAAAAAETAQQEPEPQTEG